MAAGDGAGTRHVHAQPPSPEVHGRRVDVSCEHVSRERDHDRPGPACLRDADGLRDELRDAVRAVRRDGPLGDGPVEGSQVHFLKALPAEEVAVDLAEEDDHRCRVLVGGMHADGQVGRPDAAGRGDDGRAPGHLRVGLRHE